MYSFEERKKLYKLALETYGRTAQVLKASEECAELSAAITKMAIWSLIETEVAIHDSAKVEEEMADVEIMLEQLRETLLPITSITNIEAIKERKLNRLAAALGEL